MCVTLDEKAFVSSRQSIAPSRHKGQTDAPPPPTSPERTIVLPFDLYGLYVPGNRKSPTPPLRTLHSFSTSLGRMRFYGA
ncbi:hypothetical protein CDAR_394411 [Caerostris darwini]|uniref:Uncharacterized protein n=1 Tax=Caerostris darwini TaxID=1538125 RepID=A0AAV4RDK8_9ARAC|nr:hypothetical protein CDAR_394411 [Caerostris darwini]